VLGVSNHVSWLDIIVLGSLVDAAFVSKAEIGGWPIVGRFARHTGAVFFPRGAHRTGEAVEALRATLAAGRCAVLFPEATTRADLAPDRFHARLFAAAIEGGSPAQPIAIRYLPPDGSTGHHPRAPWINDAPLLGHFLTLCRLPRLEVRVTFCAPVSAGGRDRRGLAEDCRTAILAALQVPPDAP
jgi:1-acyl-sn-glycerol-3-phosphate acyltransferase